MSVTLVHRDDVIKLYSMCRAKVAKFAAIEDEHSWVEMSYTVWKRPGSPQPWLNQARTRRRLHDTIPIMATDDDMLHLTMEIPEFSNSAVK
jgi:hypothetical protein